MENRKIYFLDVIYYNCYSLYKRFDKDLHEFSGQALTAVCLSLNLIAFIIIFQELYDFKLFTNNWYTLFISLPALLIVVVRYNKYITVNEIEDVLYAKSQNNFNKLNFYAAIYIIFSIFGTILFAIIMGELNNPPPFWNRWF